MRGDGSCCDPCWEGKPRAGGGQGRPGEPSRVREQGKGQLEKT